MSAEKRLNDLELVREARVLLRLWFEAEKECEGLTAKVNELGRALADANEESEHLAEQVADLERAMTAPCPRCGEKP